LVLHGGAVRRGQGRNGQVEGPLRRRGHGELVGSDQGVGVAEHRIRHRAVRPGTQHQRAQAQPVVGGD
jgi:hypothetical protein